MTPLAALLTLLSTLAGTDTRAPHAAAMVERIALPRGVTGVTLEVQPLESTITLGVREGGGALARALRAAPHALCAGVEEVPLQVLLRCSTRFLDARLRRLPGAVVLEIEELPGLPVKGPDAPILVPFDVTGAGDAGACGGSTALARADCALGRGDLRAARAALEGPLDALQRDAADLRLGEIALVEGDPEGASFYWKTIRSGPWLKLAAVRLCELSRSCVAREGWEAGYSTEGLPPQLALDLTLRHARILAFAGRPLSAAILLAGPGQPGASSPEAARFWRRLVSLALRSPGPDGAEALALWLELPDRGSGPGSWQDALAAAGQAEALGAPVFASSILSAATGLVPQYALSDYLARTAELYLASGDRVRAGVVVEFARNRLGPRGVSSPRWTSIIRTIAARGA